MTVTTFYSQSFPCHPLSRQADSLT